MRHDYGHLKATLEEAEELYDSAYREGCPVTRMDPHGVYYMLADHAVVRAAAADWETFSSAGGVNIPRPPVRPAAIAFDPSEHKFWRDIYNEVLSVTATRAFEQHITSLAVDLIEKFAEDQGPAIEAFFEVCMAEVEPVAPARVRTS